MGRGPARVHEVPCEGVQDWGAGQRHSAGDPGPGSDPAQLEGVAQVSGADGDASPCDVDQAGDGGQGLGSGFVGQVALGVAAAAAGGNVMAAAVDGRDSVVWARHRNPESCPGDGVAPRGCNPVLLCVLQGEVPHHPFGQVNMVHTHAVWPVSLAVVQVSNALVLVHVQPDAVVGRVREYLQVDAGAGGGAVQLNDGLECAADLRHSDSLRFGILFAPRRGVKQGLGWHPWHPVDDVVGDGEGAGGRGACSCHPRHLDPQGHWGCCPVPACERLPHDTPAWGRVGPYDVIHGLAPRHSVRLHNLPGTPGGGIDPADWGNSPEGLDGRACPGGEPEGLELEAESGLMWARQAACWLGILQRLPAAAADA
mmetsp:Transcript_108787/g.188214  ORF Transcript_108787/g.188214 Transcript_108787/m.188214 type:complete len:368 (-) Transcript_108787:1438-2541(-)